MPLFCNFLTVLPAANYKDFDIAKKICNFVIDTVVIVEMDVKCYKYQKKQLMNQTSEIKDRIDWILIFIWEFGKRFGLDMRQAFNYLKRYKAISYLENHYNYVHTQSFNSMVEEMAEYCQRHGGKLI